MEYTKPFVSICSQTFNHAPYIRQCLDGFLIQKCSFDFEILIHDDASTDGTSEIIREYQSKYPDIIKPIIQTENQWSKGNKGNNRNFNFPRASGKYIALCEGDDYWTDPLKLQKQVDFMEANPDCSLCFHAINRIDSINGNILSTIYNDNKSRYFQMKELIMGGGGLIGTQSIMFKKNIVNKLPEFFYISPAGDYPLVLLAKCNGNVYYLNEVMANYRINNNESEMGKVKNSSFGAIIDRYGAFAKMLHSFDRYTSHRNNYWVKKKSSQLITNAFRRNRLNTNLKIRVVYFLKWKQYLTFKYKILSITLFFPMPGTRKEFADLKKKLKRGWLGSILIFLYRIVNSNKTLNKIKKSNFPIQFLSDSKKATFFGYHDKTPFSKDGSKILAMSVAASDKKPESECSLMKLGYFAKNKNDIFDNVFIPFAETTTWAWQQGCMLQWNPSNANNEVIFNKLIDNNYGSVIFDINKKVTIKVFKDPIYSISPNGQYATTLNFARLGRLRPGYGYNLFSDKTINELYSENDGLYLLNMDSKKKELIVSLKTLAEEVENKYAEHYVNHAVFSPNSLKIAFFHRWLINGKTRETRFLIYNLETNSHFTLEEEYKNSHYCWIDDETILATAQTEKNKGYKYTLYNIKAKSKRFCDEVPLNTDGHPMAKPSNNIIVVTDSRINRRRDDHILLFNRKTGNVVQAGRFFMPLSYSGQVRCDLHPRWDRVGNYIVADIVKKNSRAMALIDVKQVIDEFK